MLIPAYLLSLFIQVESGFLGIACEPNCPLGHPTPSPYSPSADLILSLVASLLYTTTVERVLCMDILEMLAQVREQLRQQGRLSYRILKMQFQLNEEQLEVLREELIDIQALAVDKDGKMLVWAGSPASSVQSLESEQSQGPKSKVQSQEAQTLDPRRETLDPRPVSYTPPHLAERIRAEQAALEARGATDGERKTITALFADLKGSTALIEGLDPEEARAIIDPALQVMMDAVHRYEGYVAQVLGDGIFALFGAPIAHEDHPQRALYAALRMQEEMRRYADTLRAKGYPPLLMRVGLNTGEVVVRSIRDRKSTRLNSSHIQKSRMPSSA